MLFRLATKFIPTCGKLRKPFFAVAITALSIRTKIDFTNQREMDERNQKRAERGFINDEIRHAFLYEDKTDNELIEYIEENKVNINDYCASYVHGVYHPIFYLMTERPAVLDHYMKIYRIDPKKEIDLSSQNPYHYDFLDKCKIQDIEKSHKYGFNLTPKNYCDKYLTINSIDRAIRFIESGIITEKDLTEHMTEMQLEREIKQTHERIICDLEVHGKDEVSKYQNRLLDIINLCEKSDKLKGMNFDKLRIGLPGHWYIIDWHLGAVLEKFKTL